MEPEAAQGSGEERGQGEGGLIKRGEIGLGLAFWGGAEERESFRSFVSLLPITQSRQRLH